MSVAADLLRTFEAEENEAKEHHREKPVEADPGEDAHPAGQGESPAAGTNIASASPRSGTVVRSRG